MRNAAAAAATTWGLCALAAWAGACGGSHGVSWECRRDDQCGAKHGCSAGTCLPIVDPPAAWGVELAPLSSSDSSLAELTAVPSPLVLSAPDKVALTATVSPEAGGMPLSVAHVVLSVPATIPGRPDLQLETDLVAPMGAATASTFSLSLSASLMGRAGTLRVLPGGMDAFTQAPALLAVTVDPTLSLVIPSKSFIVQGRLRSAVDNPKVGHIARAFQGGALVSNVDVTTADGTFTLAVPAARVGPAPSQALSIELAPPSGSPGEPVFTSKPISVTANLDLGDVRLPASSQPNVFRFAIRAGTDSGPAVPGTIVHARTRLADDAIGTTTFTREGVASDKGLADLALLPGSTMLQNYEVAVVPPTDSPYAIRCIAKLPLAAGGTTDAPAILAAVVLQRRTIVDGTVLASDGSTPAVGVMIEATRTDLDPSLPCAAEVSRRLPTAQTDARGAFSLFLDPGTYRFDYDPPAGAPLPRFTETVPVSASLIGSRVTRPPTRLPAGALVEGTAHDALGRPLPLAAVRLFEVACSRPDTCTGPARVPPILRAQERTDAAGHFRAVVAAP